jgi:hypothetical protein
MRNRVSIVKEDRIWQLRCQGYDYDSIGSIVNCNPCYMTIVLRRVRRRPPIEVDPVKRGRRSNFLSDNQVEDIRMRQSTMVRLHYLLPRTITLVSQRSVRLLTT